MIIKSLKKWKCFFNIWFFQKLYPSGHQGLLFKWFQNENGVFIEMDLLPTVITNSFQIQNQTFENIFIFIFFNDFMIMKFISF